MKTKNCCGPEFSCSKCEICEFCNKQTKIEYYIHDSKTGYYKESCSKCADKIHIKNKKNHRDRSKLIDIGGVWCGNEDDKGDCIGPHNGYLDYDGDECGTIYYTNCYNEKCLLEIDIKKLLASMINKSNIQLIFKNEQGREDIIFETEPEEDEI